MFCKKTTSEKNFIEYETSDKRESFRLTSEILGPLAASYQERQAQIIDISAGGISFECSDCQEGETGVFQLELPLKRIEVISLSTQILKITGQTTCHCKFIKIGTDEEEKIHQYVLAQQIAVTRKFRTAKESDIENE